MKLSPTALALVFGLFFATHALATSFIDRPFPEVVQESPVMVRGKVGNSYADWGMGSDGNKRIFTFYELQVSELLKGKSPATASLTMREMGGEKDGIGMQVPGASQFDRGEDVVVMLSDRNSDGTFDIRGLMVGKLNVVRNQSGKEILVGPATQGLGHSAEGHTEGQNDTGTQAEWTLQALRDLIKSQGDSPAASVSAQNPAVVVSPQANAATPPKTASEASSAAPQLQNSSAAEPKAPSAFGFPTWVGLALMGVGIFATGMLLKRKKR